MKSNPSATVTNSHISCLIICVIIGLMFVLYKVQALCKITVRFIILASAGTHLIPEHIAPVQFKKGSRPHTHNLEEYMQFCCIHLHWLLWELVMDCQQQMESSNIFFQSPKEKRSDLDKLFLAVMVHLKTGTPQSGLECHWLLPRPKDSIPTVPCAASTVEVKCSL